MIDALDDSLTVAADGHCSLSAVGEHLAGHLNTGPSHLAYLLDLAATLANQGATLAGGHHKAEGYGRPWHCTRSNQGVQILFTER